MSTFCNSPPSTRNPPYTISPAQAVWTHEKTRLIKTESRKKAKKISIELLPHIIFMSELKTS